MCFSLEVLEVLKIFQSKYDIDLWFYVKYFVQKWEQPHSEEPHKKKFSFFIL